MKKVFTIAKKVFLGACLLVLLVAVGLLVYYQTIYQETPLPGEVNIAPNINDTSRLSDKPVLLPLPQKLSWETGSFQLPQTISFHAAPEDAARIQEMLKTRFPATAAPTAGGSFKFTKNSSLEAQAYHLSVRPNQVAIEYSTLEGAFYALTTLKQLAQQSNNTLPCETIDDQPDLATRGAMLDISRGKVPTLETLFGMVDFLSDLKYNHLELYIEGFSFAYPSFKELWEKTETPLTPEEIRQLDAYCKARCIELVPNQNSLGHMNAWLATEQFKSLAECPDGYKFMGLVDMKTTLAIPSIFFSITL